MGSATTPTTVSTATMPTSMTDVEATRLGLKVYVHGGSYVSGLAPTMTATGIVVRWGHFMPYQVQDGSWRLRFNFGSDVSPATTVSVSVVGVLTPSSLAEQTFCGVGLSGAVPAAQAWIASSSNVFTIRYSATSGQAFGSGDVALASKPTWAY